MDFITAIGNAISNVFKYLSGRSEARNAPDVKDAAIAGKDAADQDKLNKAIEQRNTDEIRKDLSE